MGATRDRGGAQHVVSICVLLLNATIRALFAALMSSGVWASAASARRARGSVEPVDSCSALTAASSRAMCSTSRCIDGSSAQREPRGRATSDHNVRDAAASPSTRSAANLPSRQAGKQAERERARGRARAFRSALPSESRAFAECESGLRSHRRRIELGCVRAWSICAALARARASTCRLCERRAAAGRT
jgi:hypothetical protein